MDLQIREAVEIYGSTKYISTENLLSAVLDSKKIGKILGKYEDIGKIINRSKEELGTVNSFAQISSDILAEV